MRNQVKVLHYVISVMLVMMIADFNKVSCQTDVMRDTIETPGGDLVISFIGHSSLMFEFQNQFIFLDPVSQVADFDDFPKADLILITHEHGDHFDVSSIEKLLKPDTKVVLTSLCKEQFNGGIVMKNGDFLSFAGVDIEAFPAYNIFQKRGNGKPYHIKGEGNGYILTFSGVRIYVAGDTEYIPEMKKLQNIDIAFLPVAEPFTMSLTMLDLASKAIKPKILYPYHLNRTDTDLVVKTLYGTGIDVRIRALR